MNFKKLIALLISIAALTYALCDLEHKDRNESIDASIVNLETKITELENGSDDVAVEDSKRAQTIVKVTNTKNKRLIDTVELGKKVLHSHNSKAKLERELSDPELFAHAKDVILSDAPEAERMKAVAYLIKSMSWTENPKHEFVLQTAEEIISDDKLLSDMSIEQKRSLGGDKIELFVALYEIVPKRGQQIWNSETSNTNKRLMKFAYNFYLKDMENKND